MFNRKEFTSERKSKEIRIVPCLEQRLIDISPAFRIAWYEQPSHHVSRLVGEPLASLTRNILLVDTRPKDALWTLLRTSSPERLG